MLYLQIFDSYFYASQKQKKISGDSEKADQTNQIMNIGEVIKTIQFKLLKKEIESIIVDRIKTPH